MFQSRMSTINSAMSILRMTPQVIDVEYSMSFKNSIPVYYMSLTVNTELTLDNAKEILSGTRDLMNTLLNGNCQLVRYSYDDESQVLEVRFSF